MISRKSSGSIRPESAVEPTRSENITVTCRRSARSSVDALGGCGGGRCASRGRLGARIDTQRGDGVEQLEAMPNCCDAKLLQRLVRQARKNRLVYLVLAECGLILSETKSPQPTPRSMMAS